MNFVKIFLAATFLYSFSLFSEENLSIKVFKGDEISPYVKGITDIAIEVYKEYPYLYDGTEEEYLPFIDYYSHSSFGIASLLFDGDRPVGVAIGMPLNEMRDRFKDPLLAARPDENLEKIYYLGEFLLINEYRGKGYGKKLYKQLENLVKENGEYSKLCFCKIVEWDYHPLMPNGYLPMDGFWIKQGFEICDDITVSVYWDDVGTNENSIHHLVYWMKNL